MARLLDPLKKRQVVYGGKASGEELSAWGRAYLEEGRVADALDFFESARDLDGLREIARIAAAEGDAFLFWRVGQAAPELVSEASLEELGRRADGLGKLSFSERARAGGAPPPPPFAEHLKEADAPEEPKRRKKRRK